MKAQAKLDLPSAEWTQQAVSCALGSVVADLNRCGVILSESAVTRGKSGQLRLVITFEDVNLADLDDIADEIYERVLTLLSPGCSLDASMFGPAQFQQFA